APGPAGGTVSAAAGACGAAGGGVSAAAEACGAPGSAGSGDAAVAPAALAAGGPPGSSGSGGALSARSRSLSTAAARASAISRPRCWPAEAAGRSWARGGAADLGIFRQRRGAQRAFAQPLDRCGQSLGHLQAPLLAGGGRGTLLGPRRRRRGPHFGAAQT